MAFLHRLGYYLGGFSIGIVLLFFILNGKKTRCHYGPQARVIDHLSQKEWLNLSTESGFSTDSLWVNTFLKGAKVDFENSLTQLDSCKIYKLDSYYKEKPISIVVENCKNQVIIKNINHNELP